MMNRMFHETDCTRAIKCLSKCNTADRTNDVSQLVYSQFSTEAII